MPLLIAGLIVLPVSLAAQQNRPASPRGEASTQVGGSFNADGAFQGGSWIDVTYGRPILRGREGMFGSGATYGDGLLLGAPLWRVGADQSTRFRTEVALEWEGGVLPAGEYSVFADLAEDEWTLVFADWGVKQTFQEETPNALWGAYGYTPDRDVLRTPMQLSTHSVSADQLIITFTDMTQQGGNFTIWWDDQIATAPFTVAP
ncbi:MAG: DUF2911 domain-containing protein [Gemmatimonadota bacterium]